MVRLSRVRTGCRTGAGAAVVARIDFSGGQRSIVAGTMETNTPAGLREVVVHGDASGFAQHVEVGSHRLAADEPREAGGTDTGPSPYDLLLASLGSCTSMTVAMYARRKQWPLRAVTVRLRHSKIHAADCESCETKEGYLDRIERAVELEGPLDQDQRARLLEIANKCPVHRTLTSEVVIQTRLVGDRGPA
jgi:putative redox protein